MMQGRQGVLLSGHAGEIPPTRITRFGHSHYVSLRIHDAAVGAVPGFCIAACRSLPHSAPKKKQRLVRSSLVSISSRAFHLHNLSYTRSYTPILPHAKPPPIRGVETRQSINLPRGPWFPDLNLFRNPYFCPASPIPSLSLALRLCSLLARPCLKLSSYPLGRSI